MVTLVVVFDADKEMAAIVDTDSRMGWGPAMVGPAAGEILQGFIESMPFDVGVVGSAVAAHIFQQWIDGLTATAAQAAPTSPDSPLESPGNPTVDQTPPDRTGPADGGSEPPESGPADTDMEADEGAAPTVVPCPLCGGTGVTADGEDGATNTCAMCAGTKVVRMQVPS